MCKVWGGGCCGGGGFFWGGGGGFLVGWYFGGFFFGGGGFLGFVVLVGERFCWGGGGGGGVVWGGVLLHGWDPTVRDKNRKNGPVLKRTYFFQGVKVAMSGDEHEKKAKSGGGVGGGLLGGGWGGGWSDAGGKKGKLTDFKCKNRFFKRASLPLAGKEVKCKSPIHFRKEAFPKSIEPIQKEGRSSKKKRTCTGEKWRSPKNVVLRIMSKPRKPETGGGGIFGGAMGKKKKIQANLPRGTDDLS